MQMPEKKFGIWNFETKRGLYLLFLRGRSRLDAGGAAPPQSATAGPVRPSGPIRCSIRTGRRQMALRASATHAGASGCFRMQMY